MVSGEWWSDGSSWECGIAQLVALEEQQTVQFVYREARKEWEDMVGR